MDTCLFCKKDKLRMYRLPDSESRHLFCDSCGAAGPWGETPEEARRLYETARPYVKQTCPQCNGSGFEGEAQSPCSFCGGDGWLPTTAANEYTAFLESETAKAQTGRCPNCNATIRPLHCCACEGCDGCREVTATSPTPPSDAAMRAAAEIVGPYKGKLLCPWCSVHPHRDPCTFECGEARSEQAAYDQRLSEVAAIITRHLAVTAEPKPDSSDASWRLWFDRMGDKASAEVVNWTANLVTNERLIALAEAGILPSPETPVGGEARICLTCGHEERFSDNEGGTCEKIVDEESNFCGCVCRFAAPVHAAGDK